MEEYGAKKKDLLDEILCVTSQDSVIGEYVSLHKEIIDTKEKLINLECFNSIKERLQALPPTVDDLEVRACVTIKRCPLTQETIKTPFKSVCGHIFERRAIKDYLKKNPNTCPTIGCNGKVQEKK